ncbi:serine/threonine-protein kinase [Roseospira goensis]|uniref:non-specific serine/threonine protein kinase n=1 Tax=Roseospira goensis TaxID=391922 RepID=A0A7W6WLY6_9PROT|nr:serine/threonine-protein kinase [Roseospira goensis]MBB4287203.1 tRNA A-37 threonylcarbamoyl transferase component Bud32 [Roseospira goensis]
MPNGADQGGAQAETLGHLGKYTLRRVLGKGAMGIVYEGYDDILDRTVAIKTIRSELWDSDDAAEMRERFIREARAVARMSHPNIVTLYEFDEKDGTGFIALEYVAGQTLKAHAAAAPERRLPPEEAAEIAGRILDGLAYSHTREVTHRDIKPGNIMLTPDGQVKILDFGVARLATAGITVAGSMLGTPAYMAPEQLMGKQVDHRADLYSVGVVLYEMLTGRKPHEGDFNQIHMQVLHAEPDPPSALVPGLPPALDTVVMTALAKTPDARYPDAASFAAALRDAVGTATAGPMPWTGMDPDATVVAPSGAGTWPGTAGGRVTATGTGTGTGRGAGTGWSTRTGAGPGPGMGMGTATGTGRPGPGGVGPAAGPEPAPVKRTGGLAVWLLLLLLIAAAGGAGWWWLQQQPAPPARQASTPDAPADSTAPSTPPSTASPGTATETTAGTSPDTAPRAASAPADPAAPAIASATPDPETSDSAAAAKPAPRPTPGDTTAPAGAEADGRPAGQPAADRGDTTWAGTTWDDILADPGLREVLDDTSPETLLGDASLEDILGDKSIEEALTDGSLDHLLREQGLDPALIAGVGADGGAGAASDPGPAPAPASDQVAARPETPAAPAAPATPRLEVSTPRGAQPVYAAGEALDLTLRTEAPLYTYCFYEMGHGDIVRLFPNQFASDALIRPDQALRLPGDQPFLIRLDTPGEVERVACIGAERDLTPHLAGLLGGAGFEVLAIESLDEILDAIAAAAPGPTARSTVTVRVQ